MKYCFKCGQKLNDDDKFCYKCGNSQESQCSFSNVELHRPLEDNYEVKDMNFSFVSSPFLCGALLQRGRVYTSVEMNSEKMNINTDPAPKKRHPAIYFSDIAKVKIGMFESNVVLIQMILVYIYMLFNLDQFMYVILATPVCLWFGYNFKIKIIMIDGKVINIFARNITTPFKFRDEVLRRILPYHANRNIATKEDSKMVISIIVNILSFVILGILFCIGFLMFLISLSF